jgi:hypothetical protein
LPADYPANAIVKIGGLVLPPIVTIGYRFWDAHGQGIAGKVNALLLGI